ncbi:MAG: hypothetical protein A3H69_02725 [Candidatus Sungbacteria bacterium RIFCSPLOWO2_02_FULL_47_9]|nr:MAG: Peptidase M50 [Parcubacteria group bacterium GW2011_GWA2_47_10]OGZ98990.1 MAG: hypothetical protein A3D57_01450 [Candidatus Sungbacteria bacterium RIFCSPHIGHO2_02_FULL_46_12]OHA04322.1 MAG: hypothetical protein A3A28_05975 [Candidatus Sungbacteria bacterium RIFCSPLOWO2_01_FULL_47_32]OHA10241.1 MAG: hypothetical protein A3H69_02725 [Candidatus Sungbacteria bacterium RIFCSPLOWO2_02_FULL_47_9]
MFTARVFGFRITVEAGFLFLFCLIFLSGFQIASILNLPFLFTLFIASGIEFGFLSSLLMHEAMHLVVARKYGHEGRKIFLLLFGAAGIIEKKFKEPKEEFFIALAGPLTSLTLGGIFLGTFFVLDGLYAAGRLSDVFVLELIAFFCQVFGILNSILGVFNLLPAYPTDGGRILNSFFWKFYGEEKGLRYSLVVGNVFSFLFIGAGVLSFSYGRWSGLWYILLGTWLFFQQQSIKESSSLPPDSPDADSTWPHE